MKRREIFKHALTAVAKLPDGMAAGEKTRVLRIAHITNATIRPEKNAPGRIKKCLEAIKKKEVDFVLNGGDSIFANSIAPHGNSNPAGLPTKRKKEEVMELWKLWNETTQSAGLEMFSCLGDQDLWLAEDKDADKYGEAYAIKQLKMPDRYYTFNKKNWHFIVLDSSKKDPNNENWMRSDINNKQWDWLDNYLKNLPSGTPVVCMSYYPFYTVASRVESGAAISGASYFNDKFYKYSDKKIHCISGHHHLAVSGKFDRTTYFCNGALSGFWWEEGNNFSAAKHYYRETPPGYAILDLYEDGTLINEYIPHGY